MDVGRMPRAWPSIVGAAMVAILALGIGQAGAEVSVASAPCGAEAYRQFDFWIGAWDVRDPAGKTVGSNVIEPILGGCALEERWSGAAGGVGKSLNAWSRSDGGWHQTWVGGNGLVLQLTGGLRDGRMALTGPGIDADDHPVLHRITWTPLDDGRVKQHWERSSNDGESWSDVFVGIYVRK